MCSSSSSSNNGRLDMQLLLEHPQWWFNSDSSTEIFYNMFPSFTDDPSWKASRIKWNMSAMYVTDMTWMLFYRLYRFQSEHVQSGMSPCLLTCAPCTLKLERGSWNTADVATKQSFSISSASASNAILVQYPFMSWIQKKSHSIKTIAFCAYPYAVLFGFIFKVDIQNIK